MEVDVTTEAVIQRPRQEVFAFDADPSNATAWYRNIDSVEWLTDPAVEPGSQIRFRARFLGRTLEYTYEIREVQPGLLLEMSTADGPFPMRTTYEFRDEAAGQTRMSLRNRGRPSGFASLSAPLMSRAMRRATAKDLEMLKELLESGQAPGSSGSTEV